MTDDLLEGTLARYLRDCKHQRVDRVDGGGRWCTDCGAYFPARGPVRVRFTSARTLVEIVGKREDNGS